ncbi:MAG TPA: hypothetical protein DGN60_01880 [Chloroflexi bacterium]|nr:hypothetical protein [Chloroflexota bacterium]
MKPELMEILVCPLCNSKLSLRITTEENGEILEGTLHCSNDQTVYPIEDSIPNLLPTSDY